MTMTTQNSTEIALRTNSASELVVESSLQSEAIRRQLADHLQDTTFVFNSPESLECFAKYTSTLDCRIPLHFFDTAPPSVNLPFRDIRNVQVGILAPITPDIVLTDLEGNGGIEAHGGEPAPTMSTLVQAWRDAFRALGPKHQFEKVTFDMSCCQDVEIDHIRRLLQQVSTVLYMKKKRSDQVTGNLQQLRFEAAGVRARKKLWLERALPNKLL